MAQPDPDPSASALDPLFRRLREEATPVAVAQTALGLPARVSARLGEERARNRPAYVRWAAGLAPLTALCVVWARFRLNEFELGGLVDAQAAGWLMIFFG